MTTLAPDVLAPVAPASVTDEFLILAAAELAASKLPSLKDVQKAADAFGIISSDGQNNHFRHNGHGTDEGRTYTLSITPGVLQCSVHNEVRRENTIERAGKHRTTAVDINTSWVNSEVFFASFDPETGEELDDDIKRAALAKSDAEFTRIANSHVKAPITEWSRKSRANMVKQLAMLDFSEWHTGEDLSAMVTLTLPGRWQEVAPDGKTFKNHVSKLRKRWEKAIGPWVCLWKLEFQDRGAPHMHLLMRVPATVTFRRQLGPGKFTDPETLKFEEWLSWSWADIVDASAEIDGEDKWGRPTSEKIRHLRAGTRVDFSGMKFTDPRRISMYFVGHSSKKFDGKEYQHIVPEEWQEPGKGPGRFWGYSGLEKAVVSVQLEADDYFRARRILRKLLAARNWKTAVIRERAFVGRVNTERAKEGRELMRATPIQDIKVRKAWTLGASGMMTGGFVLFNDAVQVSGQLLRAITERE